MNRGKHITWAARIVRGISRFKPGRSLLHNVQTLPGTRTIYRHLLGHQRPFASLEEAKAVLARYSPPPRHDSKENVEHHLELAALARPSDYAAMFHIAPLLPRLTEVFDLGGNAGNLFYCYSKYLSWRPELTWRVLDLPGNMALGEAHARANDVRQLQFTADWTQASGVGLLLVSGSLHYMGRPLPEMVRELAAPPEHILINRTPLTEGPSAATIQAMSGFLHPCMLYNRGQLLAELVDLGYAVVDEWKAAELSMSIPGYPEHAIPAYTGVFLRHQGRS